MGIQLNSTYTRYLGDISITDNVIRDAEIGIELRDIASSASTSMTTPTPTPTPSSGPTPVPAGRGGIDFINNTEAVRLDDVDSGVTIPISDSYWGTTDLREISDLR